MPLNDKTPTSRTVLTGARVRTTYRRPVIIRRAASVTDVTVDKTIVAPAQDLEAAERQLFVSAVSAPSHKTEKKVRGRPATPKVQVIFSMSGFSTPDDTLVNMTIEATTSYRGESASLKRNIGSEVGMSVLLKMMATDPKVASDVLAFIVSFYNSLPQPESAPPTSSGA